jgi:O-antigen ligase
VPHALNHRHAPDWALGALLVLPWLAAYTAGPTANVWPWLVSACCAVLVWLFWRRVNARLIATAWVLAAAVSAVIGLVQYFGLAHAFSPWISQTGAGEAFANLRQRNQFATLTSIGLLALIALLARQAPGPRVPGWAHAAMVLLALGNAASNSRTGLLQWVLILALTAGWALPALRGPRRLAVFALQALLAYGLAVLALPWLLSAATGLSSGGLFGRLAETPGCSSRLVLWSNVLSLIAQKPWLGWGWGELDYAHFMTLYPGPRFCDILDNAHNLPLQLAVELGVPAALVLCGGAGWLAWRAQPWRETDPARQMAWGVLAVILLHSLLEYPLWYGPFQLAFGLCVGLLWARAAAGPDSRASSRHVPSEFKKNRALAQYLRGLIATIMIAVLAFAGLDYARVSQLYLQPEARSAALRDDTLNKVRGSWLFGDEVRFAALSVTALTPDNAESMHALALQLLHYSPEPRVIEKLIASAWLLGRDEEALLYLARYRAAFPDEHARWAAAQAARPRPLPAAK